MMVRAAMSDSTLNLHKILSIDFFDHENASLVVKDKSNFRFKIYRITVITRRRSGRNMSGVSRRRAFPWRLPRSTHGVT